MNKEEQQIIEWLKNTSLDEIVQNIFSYINKLEEENKEQFRQLCKLSIKLDMETISKDKIRNKIKELSKTQAYKVGLEEYTIKILEELLN